MIDKKSAGKLLKIYMILYTCNLTLLSFAALLRNTCLASGCQSPAWVNLNHPSADLSTVSSHGLRPSPKGPFLATFPNNIICLNNLMGLSLFEPSTMYY